MYSLVFHDVHCTCIVSIKSIRWVTRKHNNLHVSSKHYKNVNVYNIEDSYDKDIHVICGSRFKRMQSIINAESVLDMSTYI
jgi:hypothetical protein